VNNADIFENSFWKFVEKQADIADHTYCGFCMRIPDGVRGRVY
jgi:hypothetical protein